MHVRPWGRRGRRCLTPFAENDENASKTSTLGTEVPDPICLDGMPNGDNSPSDSGSSNDGGGQSDGGSSNDGGGSGDSGPSNDGGGMGM